MPIVRLDRSNIVAFLVGLDQIEQMFAEHPQDTDAIGVEEGRWASLRARIDANSSKILKAAANAGGLPKLRSQHAPATGPWWHLDTKAAQHRTQRLKCMGMAIVAVAVVALAVWGVTTLFPSTASPTDTTTTLDPLIEAQKWPEALAAVETARQTQPDNPELLVWEAVLNEQLDNATQAATSLTQAQQKFTGPPAAFWTLVGTDRQQVGIWRGLNQRDNRR